MAISKIHNNISYLDELNENQRSAVENINGPSLVIAGAGSGKTRVLTYRIAHLVKLGKRPSSILALTFTNKAAKEMKERIAKIVGYNTAKYLWMGTFHSIFAKILRTEASSIGYTSNFTIYDSADSKNLIKTIVKELNYSDKDYKTSLVLNRISMAKNNLVTAKAYAKNMQFQEVDFKMRVANIYKIYQIYSNRCFKSGAMDFDDLLLQTNILFHNNKKVLEKYQSMFNYILVDEYQDTNYSQYLIVKRLAQTHKNICVVGDDAQSIYSFRGAKIENILNFKKDYPNNKLYKLEQNYRSTQNIVNAANSIILKNQKQIQKNVFSENESGNKIKLIEAYNDIEEGILVADTIEQQRLIELDEFKDYAILYRTNAQSRVFEEALRKRNIPYKIYGGTAFYQRKEIKDFLAYCKLIVNKADNEAFKRIINYPKRGIGQTTIKKISDFANTKASSMWEVAANIMKYNIGVASRTQNKIAEFVGLINYFTEKQNSLNAYDLASEIGSKSEILSDLYKDKSIESISRHENVQELLNAIKDFTLQKDIDSSELTLVNFLNDIALLTDADTESEEDKNKVTLMTIHSSKGLEFKSVFVVGLEEKLFPGERSTVDINSLEEERRLFYVAVTRAEKNLCLSYAKHRYRWGKTDYCIPSRFLRDVDEVFLESVSNIEDIKDNFSESTNETNFKNSSGNSLKKGFTVKPNFNNIKNTHIPIKKHSTAENESSNSEIQAGMKVKHSRFGTGKVLKVEGDIPNTRATIFFQSVGQKQLLLKFAKLTISK